MKTVFISYRRSDSAGYTRSMYHSLRKTFSDQQIFLDVDDIKAGSDFKKELEKQLDNSQALLVMIGKKWLNIRGKNAQRRLDSPNDWVHIEIKRALKRNIPVIPILVEGANMPKMAELPDDLKPLACRQALLLNHASFDYHVARIINVISEFITPQYLSHAIHTSKRKMGFKDTIKSIFMWIGIATVSLIIVSGLTHLLSLVLPL